MEDAPWKYPQRQARRRARGMRFGRLRRLCIMLVKGRGRMVALEISVSCLSFVKHSELRAKSIIGVRRELSISLGYNADLLSNYL